METEPRKILIVDDDSFLLDMYAMKFNKSNFSVSTALSAEIALDQLRGGLSPDIILLDIMMPVMDGFEMLKKMREDNLSSNSLVIFLSNRGQPADVTQAEALGSAGYIIKATSTPGEVIERVSEIISKTKKE